MPATQVYDLSRTPSTRVALAIFAGVPAALAAFFFLGRDVPPDYECGQRPEGQDALREAFVAGARPLLLAGVAVLLATIWLVSGRDRRVQLAIAVTATVALGSAVGEIAAAYVLIGAVVIGFVLVPVALIVVLVRRRAGRPLGNGAVLAAGWATVLGVMPFLALVIATQGEPLCFS